MEKKESILPQYDGLKTRVYEVHPTGVLCSSAAQTDGMTLTGNWMGPSTDL